MTACARPGCAGTIEDGYCDVCGMAAAPSAVPAAAAPAAPPLQAEPSSGGSSAPPLAPAGSAAAPAHSAAAPSAAAPQTSSSGRRAGSRRFGGGLVEIPEVPYRDPASAVLSNPQVPERRRTCGGCGQPVGRAHDGQPGRVEGFCRNCGTRFSFTPRLAAGELVAGQYEVLGCIAHGGVGWIYLARDHNVSDRWVVLKGLLDIGDADAQRAAVAERRFLAEVRDPGIVEIFNFVEHADPRRGERVGYIVMEYVGGRSLRQLLLDRRLEEGPEAVLPLERALAYVLDILPALDYLHGRGLLYCDFKPDNVIQTESRLRLIDLGGVRRADDGDSPIYSTVGYQAPELSETGPSVASDVYSVGRTLAVLTTNFTGFTGDYRYRLPEVERAPLLAAQDSYHRLLRRATHRDPERRFGSIGELADQLAGVLREVLSIGDGQGRSTSRRPTGPAPASPAGRRSCPRRRAAATWWPRCPAPPWTRPTRPPGW